MNKRLLKPPLYQCALLILALCVAACSESGDSELANKEVSNKEQASNSRQPSADVLVVGAGISGLSAAIEAASNGYSVLLVDMASIFGGHAVVSAGVLNIPVTPMQKERGINDSYELAIKDFITWGEDANKPWVEQYVKNAKADILDWTQAMGVEYVAVVRPPGNSVPRVHVPRGAGLALVSAIYRKALEFDNIIFRWNMQVDNLLVDNGSVIGVKTTNTRSGITQELYANAVVIATGGFQSNIDKVLANWPQDRVKPKRLLAGSGLNSQGSGLELAEQVGGQIARLDHQWNYVSGLPDPSFDDGKKGLSLFTLNGTPKLAIWLNKEGQRFTNECRSPKFNLPTVLEQTEQSYWIVYDSKNKPNITISGPGWTEQRLNDEIYSHPELAKVADSLAELTTMMGLPQPALQNSVTRYNELVTKGVDTDFGKFGVPDTQESGCETPQLIDTPPFYALTLYPLARKSLGGIQIDPGARVLDKNKRPIPGLYAVGESTGFAGINGKAGLEGTFLGPSIVTGRFAGRSIVTDRQASVATPTVGIDPFTVHTQVDGGTECSDCHRLEEQISEHRAGYQHFGFVHKRVLTKKLPCQACHSELFPYHAAQHRLDTLRLINTCTTCHGGGD